LCVEEEEKAVCVALIYTIDDRKNCLWWKKLKSWKWYCLCWKKLKFGKQKWGWLEDEDEVRKFGNNYVEIGGLIKF
jgi:hypothetical protein